MNPPVFQIGEADPALDELLNARLDEFNACATPGVNPAVELTVRVDDNDGLVAGASGWSWGQAAGIAMTWVRADQRGTGVGKACIQAFEKEALRRGCTHVFVTSFTFQAPEFYKRLGYVEIFRWEGIPTTGRDDVHMRKQL